MKAGAPVIEVVIMGEPSAQGRRKESQRRYNRSEKRKLAAARHEEKLKAERVEVRCAGCGVMRELRGTTARRYHRGRGADLNRLCRSCSRKSIRSTLKFKARECQTCGKFFSGRSGNARHCDACAQRNVPAPKACQVCGKRFQRYRNATACSDPCRRRLKLNATYFGGRLFEATGWSERTCQLCGRHVAKKAHVHHVFGHPNHDVLVVLCAGCHDVVSMLAPRASYGAEQFRRLRWFVNAQRERKPPAGRDPEPWQGIAQGEAPRVSLQVKPITEAP